MSWCAFTPAYVPCTAIVPMRPRKISRLLFLFQNLFFHQSDASAPNPFWSRLFLSNPRTSSANDWTCSSSISVGIPWTPVISEYLPNPFAAPTTHLPAAFLDIFAPIAPVTLPTAPAIASPALPIAVPTPGMRLTPLKSSPSPFSRYCSTATSAAPPATAFATVPAPPLSSL